MKKIVAVMLALLLAAGLVSVTFAEESAAETELALFDDSEKVSTGWWFHPYAEGKYISASFDSPEWFSGIWVYAYASPVACPILLSVLDENENELFSQEVQFKGDRSVTFDFGKAFAPGYYTIMFESVEADERIVSQLHFVLGSGPASDTIEVELRTMGGSTNENTQSAPAVKLLLCDPDPDYTAKPTATPKPTAAPTDELPTPVPTDAPTDAVTEKPSDNDNNKDTENKDNSGKNNVGLIVGIAAGAVVVVCVVIAIIVGKKKKSN
ncbi:MAG: hypothetical protein J5950_02985 [Clostridia bacterium]|nr:hypothetical protein [Clostridia bacterium]